MRHYITLENREGHNIQGSGNGDGKENDLVKKNLEISTSRSEPSAISAMEALDDLTSQLSQLAISKSDVDNSVIKDVATSYLLPESVMLNKVQNVLDNIIKYQT